jgi:uroporphyrinogen-III decarboxylase
LPRLNVTPIQYEEFIMAAKMTNRERLLSTLRFAEVDRPVRYETIGIDDDTYKRWAKEGWAPPNDANNFMRQFDMDIFAPAWFGGHLHPAFYPAFEEKIIEDDGHRQLLRTITGGIMERFSDGSMSIPRFVSFAVETMDDLEGLMPRLDPNSYPRVDSWSWAFELSEKQALPLFVYIPGCFGFHRHLMGFENLMAAYVLDPDLIHAMSRAWETLMVGIIDRCRFHGKIDILQFWEDMCYKAGPMISPKMFKEFIQPYYISVCNHALEQGVTGLGVDTDGDCRLLIPLFMEAGINYMEPFEVQSGMDICDVRKEYPNLVIHGGIDKRALAKDKGAIDAELASKLPFMLENRGYMPAIDHVVPPDVPLENWLYFLECVRKF